MDLKSINNRIKELRVEYRAYPENQERIFTEIKTLTQGLVKCYECQVEYINDELESFPFCNEICHADWVTKRPRPEISFGTQRTIHQIQQRIEEIKEQMKP